MKDIKRALKALAVAENGRKPLWRVWTRRLWRPYVSLAVAVSVTAWAFFAVMYETLVPVYYYGTLTHEWRRAFGAVGISGVWAAVLVVALVASVVLSIVAHRAMRKVVMAFPRQEMGRNRRVLLTVETLTLVGVVLSVMLLPLLVIFTSGVAASRSAMIAEPTATPLWVPISVACITLAAVLVAEAAMTIARAARRAVDSTFASSSTSNEVLPETV